MDLPNQCEPKKSEAKYDPGWNDPPTFSYNAQHAPGTKPRLNLNKRVAFPLQGINTSTNPTASLNPSIPINPSFPGDPLIPFNPLIPVNPLITSYTTSPSTPTLESQPIGEAQNSPEESCHVDEVVDILHNILDENAELGNKIVDIKRRISVMKTMWNEGKLDKDIQMSMLKLSKALQNADTKTADEVHRALMVDHISSVGSWMVAIKQLIFHCTTKNELLDIDKD